jgi:hypothetical protein
MKCSNCGLELRDGIYKPGIDGAQLCIDSLSCEDARRDNETASLRIQNAWLLHLLERALPSVQIVLDGDFDDEREAYMVGMEATDRKLAKELEPLITRALSTEQLSPWRRVEDGLPPVAQEVLVWVNGVPTLTYLATGGGWAKLNYTMAQPTHWMFIPPGPGEV